MKVSCAGANQWHAGSSSCQSRLGLIMSHYRSSIRSTFAIRTVSHCEPITSLLKIVTQNVACTVQRTTASPTYLIVLWQTPKIGHLHLQQIMNCGLSNVHH